MKHISLLFLATYFYSCTAAGVDIDPDTTPNKKPTPPSNEIIANRDIERLPEIGQENTQNASIPRNETPPACHEHLEDTPRTPQHNNRFEEAIKDTISSALKRRERRTYNPKRVPGSPFPSMRNAKHRCNKENISPDAEEIIPFPEFTQADADTYEEKLCVNTKLPEDPQIDVLKLEPNLDAKSSVIHVKQLPIGDIEDVNMMKYEPVVQIEEIELGSDEPVVQTEAIVLEPEGNTEQESPGSEKDKPIDVHEANAQAHQRRRSIAKFAESPRPEGSNRRHTVATLQNRRDPLNSSQKADERYSLLVPPVTFRPKSVNVSPRTISDHNSESDTELARDTISSAFITNPDRGSRIEETEQSNEAAFDFSTANTAVYHPTSSRTVSDLWPETIEEHEPSAQEQVRAGELLEFRDNSVNDSVNTVIYHDQPDYDDGDEVIDTNSMHFGSSLGSAGSSGTVIQDEIDPSLPKGWVADVHSAPNPAKKRRDFSDREQAILESAWSIMSGRNPGDQTVLRSRNVFPSQQFNSGSVLKDQNARLPVQPPQADSLSAKPCFRGEKIARQLWAATNGGYRKARDMGAISNSRIDSDVRGSDQPTRHDHAAARLNTVLRSSNPSTTLTRVSALGALTATTVASAYGAHHLSKKTT